MRKLNLAILSTSVMTLVTGFTAVKASAKKNELGASGVAQSQSLLVNSPGSGPSPGETPAAEAAPVSNPTCHSDDPDHMCLALNYVVYKNSSDQPVVTQQEAIKNVEEINQLYKQCNVSFQIDQYQAVNPKDFGLTYQTANNSELTSIRKAFVNSSTLLVTTTGTWDRSGSLGNTGANAWASMPGEDYMGVVLEKPVGKFGNIIGHELGHYLNLDHVNDRSDLMNPTIYDDSTKLTPNQCKTIRSTVTDYWQKMIR
jgi:hypothetical protein